MLNFSSPTLSDKSRVNSLLSAAKLPGCEYTFGNLIIWSEIYKNKIALGDDFLFSLCMTDDPHFSFPAGGGDLREALALMEEYARANNFKELQLYGLLPEHTEEVERLMPGKFSFEPYRDGFDYVYSVEKLAKLPGKKLHGKRNHISAFKKLYPDWEYEEITRENIALCAKMNEAWEKKNAERGIEGLEDEKRAIALSFENFFELDFRGGLLKAGGEVVAYTMGEAMPNGNTFCTHIEKAFADVRGAYPMINREFAANTINDFTFVNREEDLGEEGLRKAKTSYRPEFFVEKYTAHMPLL